MRYVVFVYMALLLFQFLSCSEPKVEKNVQDTSELKKSLERANRYLVRSEEEDIENYIRRHSLNMVNTGTGLRYQILEQGDGAKILTGQKVTLEYELVSITGDLIYSSAIDGPMKFIVGEPAVESGMNEAILHLHLGDKAKIIIPSHLAYGLAGDQKKIPSRATLIYTVKITEIE
jgi:FKBP-type peptidyl-prolyl cis-trans isomerases 1